MNFGCSPCARSRARAHIYALSICLPAFLRVSFVCLPSILGEHILSKRTHSIFCVFLLYVFLCFFFLCPLKPFVTIECVLYVTIECVLFLCPLKAFVTTECVLFVTTECVLFVSTECVLLLCVTTCFFCMSSYVFLPLSVSVSVCVCASVCLVHLSVCLSVCMYVCPSLLMAAMQA